MHMKLGLRLALVCVLTALACSGDDEDQSSADAGTSSQQDGGQGGDRGAAMSGGKGTGSGEEGVECTSNSDCSSSLSCLHADARIDDLKVCARPCGTDDECKDDERCLAVTGAPADGMCWGVVTKALEPCGPAFTSMCDVDANLGCLRVEDTDGSVAGGVCLEPCKLPGKDEDDPCSDDLACLDVLGKDGDGVCARKVDRGEVCDEPKGVFCGPGDFCLSDGEEWRCYQDCTESKSCDDDKECKDLDGEQGSYCD